MQTRITTAAALASLLLNLACSSSSREERATATAGASRSRTALVDAPDRWLDANGARLRYREIGQGAPVILLHGYTDNLAMWSGPADSLARDHRVIVPDVRGFGLSSKSGDPSFYGQQMVADVGALLDHLDLPSAHLIGYSMGGAITANFVLQHPTRVSSATFVAGALFPDSAALGRLVNTYADHLERGDGLAPFFRYILPTWPDSMIRQVLPGLVAQNDSASLVAALRGLASLDVSWEAVSQTTIPAVSVVSAADPMVVGARALERHWPGIRSVILPRGDHADIHLAPEVLTEFRRLTAASR
ncbi:MAG: alpha/beta hydrolase [Gemmatimonadaceae bacterium]|nr:alpha/beta hydrolase [Gemmatimonadaceae bacterium]